ncbi:MAG: UDP-glucose 4-epimerase GalE [Legionellaceae bacterium]|nr:UDP-glucose 4-epimerase GalE [Legionellaceae bacterium]
MLKKKIIVTGGAGYIGSHFCKVASLAGYEVIVIDNLSTGFVELARWGVLYRIDVRDVLRIKALFKEIQPAYVVHFAASAYVGESCQDPLGYYGNNVTGLQSILMACVEVSCGVIFSSTCAVYGNPSHLPLTEDAVLRPVNPYGDTKLACERLLHWCGKAYGLKWVALRYFNAAGADPDLEIGELHDPETHLIPLILKGLGKKEGNVEIYGNNYPTKDGTAIRDYVHVLDLAEAHLLSLEFLYNGGTSRAFNLGTGSGASVLEVIDAVQQVSGTRVNFTFHDRRPGDPAELFADAVLAREVLDWQPKYCDLEMTIKTAWKWELLQREKAEVEHV